MEHVLQALHLGERAVAKDLLARVSKTLLSRAIEAKKTALPHFPQVQRITAEAVELDGVRSLFITRRTVWVRVEPESAERLTLCARQLAEEIAEAFTTANNRVYMVDALITQIGERDEGFVSFDWKQKYVLS